MCPEITQNKRFPGAKLLQTDNSIYIIVPFVAPVSAAPPGSGGVITPKWPCRWRR